jgi:hypothetical protein
VQNQKDTDTYLADYLPKAFTDLAKQESKKGFCDVLIQTCFFPRLMHSARDALYTF